MHRLWPEARLNASADDAAPTAVDIFIENNRRIGWRPCRIDGSTCADPSQTSSSQWRGHATKYTLVHQHRKRAVTVARNSRGDVNSTRLAGRGHLRLVFDAQMPQLAEVHAYLLLRISLASNDALHACVIGELK